MNVLVLVVNTGGQYGWSIRVVKTGGQNGKGYNIELTCMRAE